ncbi:MAG: DivIVA domain-containing protein, partial [Actinomycetota bacterium]|nr:DivIVA domain-containing protein [Actinomycetota bacterium]
MRALTPDDIVNYPLKQAVRGYSVRQVDDLLDRVADELERVHHELSETRQRLAQAEARAESLSEAESTLKRTLVAAQRAAEQILAEAHERAATVVEQAQKEAERQHRAAVSSTREELDRLRRDERELSTRIEALREFERDYRSTLRSFVERHLRALDELQQRVAPSVPGAEQAPERGRAAPEEAGPDGQDRVAAGGAGQGGQVTAGPEGPGGARPQRERADRGRTGFEDAEEGSESRPAPHDAVASPDLVEDPMEEQENDAPLLSQPTGDGQQASALGSPGSLGSLEAERPEEARAGSEPRRAWPSVDLSRGEHLRRQVEEAFNQVLTGLDDDEDE